ncbi:hypothetical protein BDV93DRAFT_584362 [Ceratobasidium sp. AG-I]|nr:hypothetical protein BDV93DRAFT_584362 [Ceratobasidium sp. AG-I]
MPLYSTETPSVGGRSSILPLMLRTTSKNDNVAETHNPDISINQRDKAPKLSKDPEAPAPGTHEQQPLKDQKELPRVDLEASRTEEDADIWNLYVDEAGKWDKELSEGWDKMIDIVLIFAALFSAISTAFVLESHKDLKPDPAESSAVMLRTMTQILLAMFNQSALATISLPPAEFVFAPSTSAVAVNMLWFTSLILSVTVILVVMWAKEWSHLFMTGRNGLPFDQARRRQQ